LAIHKVDLVTGQSNEVFSFVIGRYTNRIYVPLKRKREMSRVSRGVTISTIFPAYILLTF